MEFSFLTTVTKLSGSLIGAIFNSKARKELISAVSMSDSRSRQHRELAEYLDFIREEKLDIETRLKNAVEEEYSLSTSPKTPTRVQDIREKRERDCHLTLERIKKQSSKVKVAAFDQVPDGELWAILDLCDKIKTFIGTYNNPSEPPENLPIVFINMISLMEYRAQSMTTWSKDVIKKAPTLADPPSDLSTLNRSWRDKFYQPEVLRKIKNSKPLKRWFDKDYELYN